MGHLLLLALTDSLYRNDPEGHEIELTTYEV